VQITQAPVAVSQNSPTGQVIAVFTQPVAELQESVVQALLSSQVIAVLTHAPVVGSQLSAVQALLSSQFLAVKTHPVAVLHESTVHNEPSSQFKGDPGTQTPPEQESFTVHASWSSQVVPSGFWLQGSAKASVVIKPILIYMINEAKMMSRLLN